MKIWHLIISRLKLCFYLSCYVADPLQYASITSLSEVREGPVLLFLKSPAVLLLTSVRARVSLIFSKRHMPKTRKHNSYDTTFS